VAINPDSGAGQEPPTVIRERTSAAKAGTLPLLRFEVIDTPPALGQPLTCTVVARNEGGADLHGVRVRHVLPATLRLVSVEPPGQAVGGTLAWDLGKLAAGASAILRFQIDPAEGDRPPEGSAPFGVSYSLSVPLIRPRLVLSVRAPERVPVGEPVPLRVRVTNIGNAVADDVMLRARLGPGLQHPGGSLVGARLGTLVPGKARKVALEMTARQAGRQSIELTALSGPSQAEFRCEVLLTEPALSLGLTGPTHGFAEQEVEYALEVSNTGTADARGVWATCAVPAELDVVDTGGGALDAATREVAWSLEAIPAGQVRRPALRLRPQGACDVVLRARAWAEQGLTAAAELAVRAEIEEKLSDTEVVLDLAEPELPPEPAALPEAEPPAEQPVAAAPPPPPPPPPPPAPPDLKELVAAPDSAEAELFVVFALAGAEYALPLTSVYEIAQPQSATPVPDTPEWVLGVTSVGGDIVPMVDLGGFLGLGRGPEADNRLLVVRNRNADHATGLVVDRVTGVRTLPPDHAALAADERVAPFVQRMAQAEGRPLPVLDPDLLMQTPEMQQFGVT
jgi:uncharacterized repeat protein (TIGR01451 family)